MENNNITEAGHQAGMINVGLIGFAVLLVLALLFYGVDKFLNLQSLDCANGTSQCSQSSK